MTNALHPIQVAKERSARVRLAMGATCSAPRLAAAPAWAPSQREPQARLRRARANLRRQRGFSMVEFGLVLILSTILLATQITQVASASNIAVSNATGQYLNELQGGVNVYVQNFFSQLSTNQSVVFTPLNGGASYTVAHPTAPTIADLQGVHVLTASFAAVAPDGLTFTNSITVDPGTCPGINCVITGLTYANSALTNPATGLPRTDLLGQAIQSAGFDAGMSFGSTPGTLTGNGGGWSATNPKGNVAGVLAIRTGDLSGLDALLSQFYMLNGSRALTGTMNANNNSIHSVNDLTANTIEANQVTLPGGPSESLNVGAVQFYGDGSNAAIRAPGSLFLQEPNGTGALNIAEVGTINSTGTITAPVVNFNTSASTCSWNQTTMRGNNEMWVCNEYGNWVPISAMIGNVYTVQKYLGYMDGWGVGKPACTDSTATATIIPQTTGVNVAANPPWETTVYKLVDEGTWWYVEITLLDPNGAGYSGNNLGLTAEVDAQCTYGNT